MKQRRSIDPDGLDGILHMPAKALTKPAWVKSLWLIPVGLALLTSVFFLQKPMQTIPSTTPTAAPIVLEQTNTEAPAPKLLPDTKLSAVPTPSGSKSTTSTAPINDTQVQPPSIDNGDVAAPKKLATLPVASSFATNDVKSSTNALFTVYFKLDSSVTNPLSTAETSKLINIAQQCRNRIGLTGHTCNLGKDAVNQKLGLARANALKKLLTRHGITAQRIVTTSEGMRKSVAPNDTLSGQALNRRAELYCLEK